MKILIALIVVIVLIILFVIKTYNALVSLRELVKNSMGQISANVESRWDALKSLIDATKKYSEHESNTLKEVIQARSGVTNQSTVKDIEKDNDMFTQAMSKLAVVVEAYPDLKADSIYQNTMNKIHIYEQDVKNSRMVYNDTVTRFNRKMLVFPTVLIARMLGFTEFEYFKNTESKAEMPSWN